MADDSKSTAVLVQLKTLDEEGRDIWVTAKSFYADADQAFAHWDNEAQQFVDKTHDEVVAMANDFKAKLQEIHTHVRVVKNTVQQLIHEVEL